jgi:hypothetical protein
VTLLDEAARQRFLEQYESEVGLRGESVFDPQCLTS